MPRSRHPLLPLHPLRLRPPLHLLHGKHERRVVGHQGDPGDDRPAVCQGEGTWQNGSVTKRYINCLGDTTHNDNTLWFKLQSHSSE